MMVISHNYGQGARELSRAISNGRLLLKNSRRDIPRRVRTVVNFGVQENARLERFMARGGVVLNNPSIIRNASSKTEFLTSPVAQSRRPYATTDRNEVFIRAQQGEVFFARTLTRADSGRGIEFVTEDSIGSDPSSVVRAPLYTRAINKQKEFRVHVGRTGSSQGIVIIDVRRKALRSGLNEQYGGRENWPRIWNHENGFVFKARDVTPETVPADVIQQAKTALADTRLDFAAMDVVWDGEQAYVLEVNTAPGLTGRTVERYAEFFLSFEGGNSFTQWEDLDFNALDGVLQAHREG